jgi:hypothetical protein
MIGPYSQHATHATPGQLLPGAAGPGSLVPAQVEFAGGSDPFVVAAFVTFFAAVVLSVVVTRKFVAGYRSTGSRAILWLAVGMFLLAPAPMFLRLLLGNVSAVDATTRGLATTLSELTGLLAVLYVVYRR